MIELDIRNRAASGDGARHIPVVGIGGAGANVLDRLALDGVAPALLIAMNSDAQALTASVAGEKIQLGVSATRGLGCGGDPELGRCAAEESSSQISSALEGADAVILAAGLGGGTGSGAIPLAAELAHEAGSLVIAVVTLPFEFEGKRRGIQAAEALTELQRNADAVICFENDRMGESVPATAGIQTAFAAADQTLSQCIQAVAGILKGSKGLITLGLDDLAAILQDLNVRCLFGHGQADGKNRSFDALSRALKNPLMDKGRLLRDCDTVVVRVCGGPDLTLNEVQLLMEEFNRYVNDHTRILFGTAIEPSQAGKVSVSILSASSGIHPAAARPSSAARQERVPAKVKTAPPEPELILREAAPEPEPAPAPSPEPVEAVVAAESAEAAAAIQAAEAEAAQETAEKGAFALEPTGADEAGLPVVDPGEQEVQIEGSEPQAPQAAPGVSERRHQKPRGLRTPSYQGSLFGEEPVEAPERIAPPVPGRMLRNPFPPPEPEPEVPAPVYRHAATLHPQAPAAEARPEPVREEPVAPIVTHPMQAATQPVPEPEPESITEPEPADMEPEAAAPAPPPAPRQRPGVMRRGVHRAAVAPSADLISLEEQPPSDASAPGKAPQQEVMQFEPVTRGRFEKSEPTIVDGQDLDIPTYLRRRLKIR